jgi:exodeoxyribonuclease VII large subunit
VVGGAQREVDAERRALDRLHPAARLAAGRERAGELLERATRATRSRIADARQREDRLAAALPVVVTRRLGQARAGLDSALSALAVLGPNATLERGYAIVRRVEDGAIVRDPVAAPPGTGLAVRVARGEFPATAAQPTSRS